jgi:hypothetical protein
MQLEYIGLMHVSTATYSIKMSILFLYRRVLLVTPGYRYICLSLMIVSTAWYKSTVISTVLICRPLDALRYRSKPGRCGNMNELFLGLTVTEALIYLMILLLPLQIVLGLHVPMSTKVADAGVFALGGLSTVTNVLRIQYTYEPDKRNGKIIRLIIDTLTNLFSGLCCSLEVVHYPLVNGHRMFLSAHLQACLGIRIA